ncbi:MAG: hypothetical protein ACHQAY_01275 [Hyphomicrobiales bacterium]
MTLPAATFLDTLKAAAEAAEAAESSFRREVAERVKLMERDRAFAFRRLNLMRAIAAAIANAEAEDVAVASALTVLRAKLGWSSDSEARDAVLSRFAAVAKTAFASIVPADTEMPEADVVVELSDFEAWYAVTHPAPFWALFEHYMPETPVVDF